jgi:hypothetical protein
MKIGSDIVNFFVFHKHDGDTSKYVLNQSNYNKHGSPEAPRFTCVLYSWRRKDMGETRVDWTEFTWAFDYICWTDFLFAHRDNPPSPVPLKKLRVAETTHQLRN